ncbi:MAG: ABC transporter ATP-binding protein [Prevotella sp.]|nr:ABC transporter ATP-binding protein [Prevotella sp.]
MRQPNFNRNHGGPRAQAGFQKIDKQQRSTLIRLLRLVMKHYKWMVLTVLVCIAISSVTSLASTLFTRTLIDDYIVPLVASSGPAGMAAPLGAAAYYPLLQALLKLGLILLLGVACSYTYNRLMIYVSQGTQLRLRKQLFERMERLPLSYFDSHSHGELMSTYTNDVDSLRQVISTSMAQVFNSLITIVVTFTSMMVLSIPLTCVSIFIAVLMSIATTRLGKWSRGYFRTQQESLASVNGFIEEMMTGQKVVKTFCHEEQAIDDFERINEQLRSSACNANRIASIVMPVNGNLGQLGYVLIAVVGASIALGSYHVGAWQFTISLGTIVAFLQLNKSFTQPISHVSQQINSVLNASVGAERVFKLMDAEPEEDNGTVTMEDGKWTEPTPTHPKGGGIPVRGDVDFRHVNFGYVPEKQVLYDININTLPGQKIAFVGGTGAGKTTIINLINRFYNVAPPTVPEAPPSSPEGDTNAPSAATNAIEAPSGAVGGASRAEGGAIFYDGIPINDIKLDALRSSMSIVLQETHLFTASVLDNIRYGRLDATDEECREAARLVGADDFILRLADGYHTMLSGDGGNLSQGERQLLAIARAAVANPPVLILDEATSSIDTHTEQLVQRGMDSIMRGRTTFVIAHRLSTVRNADQIIVLDHGRIIEHGSHDELIRLRGRYYQLYTGDTSLLA